MAGCLTWHTQTEVFKIYWLTGKKKKNLPAAVAGFDNDHNSQSAAESCQSEVNGFDLAWGPSVPRTVLICGKDDNGRLEQL